MFNNPTDAGAARAERRLGLPPDEHVYRGQQAVALPGMGAFTMRQYVPGSHRATNPRTVEYAGGRLLGSYMLEPTVDGDAASYRAEAAGYVSPWSKRTRIFMPVRSYGRRVQLRPVLKRSQVPGRVPPLLMGRNSRDFSMVDTHFKKDLPINSTSRRQFTAPLRHYRMLFPEPILRRTHAPAAYRRARMYGAVQAAAAAVVPPGVAGLIRDYTYANPPFQRFEPARAAAAAAGVRLPAALGGLINSYTHQAHVFGHPDGYFGFRGRPVIPRSRDALRASGVQFRRRMRKYKRGVRAQRRYRRSGIFAVQRLMTQRRRITWRGRQIRAGPYRFKSRGPYGIPSIAGAAR